MLKLLAFAILAILPFCSNAINTNAEPVKVDVTSFMELPNITTFDMDAYKKDHRAQVCVPYKNAISFLAGNILEYLANAPIPKFAIGGRKIAKHLNTQAQSFSKQLGTVSNSSTALCQHLNQEVEDVVSEKSAYQTQMQKIDRDMQSINQEIWQTNAQINEAQNRVEEVKKNRDEAQRNYDRTLADYIKRNKGAGKMFCTHPEAPFHPICSVIPNLPTDDVDRKRAELSRNQDMLQSSQAELNRAENSLTPMYAEKNSLQATKNGLTSQLTLLQHTQSTVTDLDTKLKSVIARVNELFGESKVFIEVVKNLIDMTTILDPLTSIADKVMDFTPDKGDVTQLNAIKDKINATLPLVEKKLAQYELIPQSRWG